MSPECGGKPCFDLQDAEFGRIGLTERYARDPVRPPKVRAQARPAQAAAGKPANGRTAVESTKSCELGERALICSLLIMSDADTDVLG